MNKTIIICCPGNSFPGKFITSLTFLIKHLSNKGFKVKFCTTYSRNIYEVRNKCLMGKPGNGKNQKLFNSAKNIFGENSFNNNPLSTFANMTKYNNFIVGNSTFSLLAAFLKEDTSSKIIVASPWFRNINHPGFNFDKWIKINNE